MERVGKELHPICRKIYSKNLADAFAVSAMLNYFIEAKKWDEGIKYIIRLGLDELDRSRLTKAFKSYQRSC